jgi:hypothetical protein
MIVAKPLLFCEPAPSPPNAMALYRANAEINDNRLITGLRDGN